MADLTILLSDDIEDVKTNLRKFTLDSILKKIGNTSIDLIMNRNSDDEFYGARRVRKQYNRKGSLITKTSETIVTSWELTDLAYHAVLFTNDYRGKPIENDDEFLALVQAESVFLNSADNNKEAPILLYLLGFIGEQIKFQKPQMVFDNLTRELYILFESSKGANEIEPIDDIVMKEVGVNWKKVVSALSLASLGSMYMTQLDDYIEKLVWDEEIISRDEFCKVLEKYTSTYTEIKESELGRQVFYTTPFVKTSKKETISINCYLNLFVYEHCIYWLVRNYYQKQNNQAFVNAFGKYFEEYFLELLSTYLKKGEYERIPEGKRKRADWKLKIGEYQFLIEQKSALMALSVKQQDSNVAASIDYYNKAIKALIQLHNTELEFNEGRFIKIILLYEDYVKPEVLNYVFELKSCTIENDHYYWIITIDEMERLLSLCSNNRDLFYRVIQEKIRRENEVTHEGRSIYQLLLEKGISDNPYLKLEKFQDYREIAFNDDSE